jgi:hypothetical protein
VGILVVTMLLSLRTAGGSRDVTPSS